LPVRQQYAQRHCKLRVLDWQVDLSTVLLERLRSPCSLERCCVLRGIWALNLINLSGERWVLNDADGLHCARNGHLAAPALRPSRPRT
jgi:hypothetical protein